MRKTAAFIALIILLAAQCAWAAPKKVTLVLEGADTNVKESYTGQLAEGLQNAQARFGKRLVTQVLNVQDDHTQLEPTLEKAASDSDLVLVASPLYGKFIPAAKKAHPKCTFVALDFGSEEIEGAVKLSFRDEEGGFLAGALAAMITTREDRDRINPDKIIGILMGADVPAVQRFKKGYIIGAHYIDPSITVLSENINDFANKDKAAAAALRLKKDGADVIFCAAGAAGIGAMEAAKRGGYWTIGVDAQMETLFPESVLASILKLNSHAVYRIVEGLMKNETPEKDLTIGMKEDALDISTWSRESKGNIPVDIIKRLDALEDKLSKGLIVIRDINYQSIK